MAPPIEILERCWQDEWMIENPSRSSRSRRRSARLFVRRFPSSHNFNAIKLAKFETKRSHWCTTSSFTICSKSTQAEKSRSLLVRGRDDRFSHRSFSPSFNSLHSVLIRNLIDLFPNLSSHGRMQCKPKQVDSPFPFLSQIWASSVASRLPLRQQYKTFVKARWIGRELLEILVSQFRERTKEYYVSFVSTLFAFFSTLLSSPLMTVLLIFHPRNSLSLGFSKDLGYPSRDCQSERQTCHGETGASKWRLHRVRLLDVLWLFFAFYEIRIS